MLAFVNSVAMLCETHVSNIVGTISHQRGKRRNVFRIRIASILKYFLENIKKESLSSDEMFTSKSIMYFRGCHYRYFIFFSNHTHDMSMQVQSNQSISFQREYRPRKPLLGLGLSI